MSILAYVQCEDDDDVEPDADEEEEQDKIKARQDNKTAMAWLTMSFKAVKLLRYIRKATTTDWPSGLAYLTMRELKKRYDPYRVYERKRNEKKNTITKNEEQEAKRTVNESDDKMTTRSTRMKTMTIY